VRIDFEDEDGDAHLVFAKYRPLGLILNNNNPRHVSKFTPNSYAKHSLGFARGCTITRIGNEPLDEHADISCISRLLSSNLAPLPVWPITLTFNTAADGSGTSSTASFTETPIGFSYNNTCPIKVNEVYNDSPAHEAGVEVGWYLTKIGTELVTETTDFKQAQHWLREGMAGLDKSHHQYKRAPGIEANVSNVKDICPADLLYEEEPEIQLHVLYPEEDEKELFAPVSRTISQKDQSVVGTRSWPIKVMRQP